LRFRAGYTQAVFAAIPPNDNFVFPPFAQTNRPLFPFFRNAVLCLSFSHLVYESPGKVLLSGVFLPALTRLPHDCLPEFFLPWKCCFKGRFCLSIGDVQDHSLLILRRVLLLPHFRSSQRVTLFYPPRNILIWSLFLSYERTFIHALDVPI